MRRDQLGELLDAERGGSGLGPAIVKRQSAALAGRVGVDHTGPGVRFVVELDAAYPGANVAFWVTDTRVHRENMIEWIQLFNPPERSAPYVAYLREHGL